MITTIRLPLGQFEFIEQSFDRDMTPEEAVEAFRALQRAYKPEAGEGLRNVEFNAFLDRYLTDGTGITDTYAKMNAGQQACIQTLKRAFKRISYKNGETEIDTSK